MKWSSCVAAWAIMAASALSVSQAATIDIALEDFQASGVITYRYLGGGPTNGSAGLFRFGTQNPSGSPADLLTNPAFGFCIELDQPFTGDYQTYDIGPVTSATVPPSPAFGTISPESALLIRQLWELQYDDSWENPGPYSIAQIATAVTFHAMLYEIAIDFDGVSLSSVDLTKGNFIVDSAHILDVNNPLEELPIILLSKGMLFDLSLDYDGPLANVLALTNPEYQDYLTEVAVPEASSLVLAALGAGLVGFVGWRRRRTS